MSLQLQADELMIEDDAIQQELQEEQQREAGEDVRQREVCWHAGSVKAGCPQPKGLLVEPPACLLAGLWWAAAAMRVLPQTST